MLDDPAVENALVSTVAPEVGVGKRLALPEVRPGIFALRSPLGLRKWMADQLMATSLGATNTLYATLYALPWLRRLGATIGERAEVSTAAHIDPDLLVLGAESFVADLAAVGSATLHNGHMALGRTELGRRCFVGNGAVVRGHTRLGESSLIGVASVPPTRPVDPETSWLGSRPSSCPGGGPWRASPRRSRTVPRAAWWPAGWPSSTSASPSPQPSCPQPSSAWASPSCA
jgi:non-ribosomal peptide synthetase-like protein